MDAVKYLKEIVRMCKSMECCKDCAFSGGITTFPCKSTNKKLEYRNPEEAVAIVEKWAAEHPVKTRQSEFLKIFPDAAPLGISPCRIDINMAGSECCNKSCAKCRREYWNQEVEDDK